MELWKHFRCCYFTQSYYYAGVQNFVVNMFFFFIFFILIALMSTQQSRKIQFVRLYDVATPPVPWSSKYTRFYFYFGLPPQMTDSLAGAASCFQLTGNFLFFFWHHISPINVTTLGLLGCFQGCLSLPVFAAMGVWFGNIHICQCLLGRLSNLQ